MPSDPLNDKNSGALAARNIAEKSIRGQVGSAFQLRQHVTDRVACSQIGRNFDVQRRTKLLGSSEGLVQKRGVLILVVELFGLIVDGHSCRYPEPCEVVVRNVAITADRQTTPLGPVASLFRLNGTTRGAISTTRVVIHKGVLLIPTRLFVTQRAVPVAVCPDRGRGGRQKHDDRQKTGKRARVRNIDFHNAILPPTSGPNYVYYQSSPNEARPTCRARHNNLCETFGAGQGGRGDFRFQISDCHHADPTPGGRRHGSLRSCCRSPHDDAMPGRRPCRGQRWSARSATPA